MAKKPRTNPNGANQYQLDPRQKLCWDFYIDPTSETFSSALASALKAGYTQGTANQITTEHWFIERVRTMNMLEKAEKVLNDMLEIDVEEPVTAMFGVVKDKEGNDLMKRNPNFVRIKQDTAKFVAERVGKTKYSVKSEVDHTSKGEKILGFNFITNETNNTPNGETGTSVEVSSGQPD